MQHLEESKRRVITILRSASRMAQRYGQIGLEEPDDIAQSVMLKLFKHKVERDIPNSWLYKTVRSAAMDAGRRHIRESRWLCSLDGIENMPVVSELDNEQEYLHADDSYVMDLEVKQPDLIPRLKNMLVGLSKPLRQVLMLHADGYSDQQIADMTNTKLGTVRSRLHYARKRARDYMGELG